MLQDISNTVVGALTPGDRKRARPPGFSKVLRRKWETSKKKKKKIELLRVLSWVTSWPCKREQPLRGSVSKQLTQNHICHVCTVEILQVITGVLAWKIIFEWKYFKSRDSPYVGQCSGQPRHHGGSGDLKSVGFCFFFKQLWTRIQQHCSGVTRTERPPPPKGTNLVSLHNNS